MILHFFQKLISNLGGVMFLLFVFVSSFFARPRTRYAYHACMCVPPPQKRYAYAIIMDLIAIVLKDLLP
jgi:hypothetical protein